MFLVYLVIGRMFFFDDDQERGMLLKVNVEISTFRGRSQGLHRSRNISSSIKGRIVLPL